MKFLIVLVALVASVAAGTLSRDNIEPLSLEHVEYSTYWLMLVCFPFDCHCWSLTLLSRIYLTVNSLNTSWTAKHNFKGLKIEDLKKLCGTFLEDDEDESYRLASSAELSNKLPANFDSSEQWPECKETILHVRDQGESFFFEIFKLKIIIFLKIISKIFIQHSYYFSNSFKGSCGSCWAARIPNSNSEPPEPPGSKAFRQTFPFLI